MPETGSFLLNLSSGRQTIGDPSMMKIHRPQDCAIIVAWLERFEDGLEYSRIDRFTPLTDERLFRILLHPD